MKDKVIILDWGMFSYISITSYISCLEKGRKAMPIDYTCLNMIISALRRIGISPFDKVIIACEGRKNWRKDYSKEYKADRKKIDPKYWKPINRLLEQFDKGTEFHICKHDRLEADDWMAIAPKFFKDKEVIICSFDHDLEQCWLYENVKIFSPRLKFRNGKGAYKIKPEKFDPYKMITKMIQKETSDNLTSDILTKQDYELRRKLVSLIELPQWIEDLCFERFSNLKKEEEPDLSIIPYEKLREKIGGIYNDNSKIVTYEDSIKREKRKKNKRRKR